jgi:hypothetical protein
MQSLKKSFDILVKEKPSQLILAIVFVIYILLNVQTPAFLATSIDNIFGKVLVVAIAAVVFMKTNPVIGVLGFVVAYQIIKTSSVSTGSYAIRQHLPSEANKMKDMRSFNATEPTSTVAPNSISMSGGGIILPGTLEEEMVDKMAPLVMHGGDSTLDYKPVLDGQHGASLLD